MEIRMSHEGNDRIKEQVSEEVDNMPALELLNKCDELGIKTSEIPMEELMDQLQDATSRDSHATITCISSGTNHHTVTSVV